MEKIHPLLNKEKQILARRYEKEKRILGLASAGLSLLILVAFYLSGLSAWLANLRLRSFVLTFILYVAAIQFILAVLGLPLNFTSSYIHEHRWKFSNQTFSSWLWDEVKSFLVGLALMFIMLGLLLWVMASFPRVWWFAAGAVFALVSVVMATIFPVVVLPVFNKYMPIQDKELVDALERTLSEGGLKSSGFFKEDMSRQTKKENAFLAGLGKTRRVVLGDNLMDKMSVAEIESIIAHEVGHYKHRHIWKSLVVGTLQSLVVFYILNWVLKLLFPQFLASSRWNMTLLPLFFIIFGLISGILFGPLGNALSRFFERQADRYALKSIDDKKAFMTALAGLADRNLSNAYPAWWVKLLFYSHPPIGERLAMAEKWVEP
jgi:STE24 endopeptidase